MRRSTAAAAALLLCLVVLAGCGQDDQPPAGANPNAADSSAPSLAPTDPTPTASSEPSLPALPSPSDPEPSESITVPALPRAQERGLVVGGDVSWPQCPRGMGIPQKRTLGAPMPVEEVEFVIIGLTNGPAFYPNPCLADQVDWVRDRHLRAAAYSVLSYPEQRHLDEYADDGPYDADTDAGALANTGYAQARFNVATMRAAGLRSPLVWIDVEPVADFDWSRDHAANAAVVRGAVRGYRDLGFEVGVYSTAHMWGEIVGDLRLGLPEWRPAGETSRAEALRRCGPAHMFQGGHGVLGQWVENDRDMNITCPGTSTYLDVWFHQF